MLYEHYIKDPLEMLTPEDVLADESVLREDLLANIHYLNDRGLVELMIGYNPPMFAAVRITADGIDLVEDRYMFNLRFPPEMGELEETSAGLPLLMERLVSEGDFSSLDGEKRMCLLRDLQFLRDELARPAHRWRVDVMETILMWVDGHFRGTGETLPSLQPFREALRAAREDL
ncbi:MAG: hypothetical protein IT364_22660 [Candidatus Hydrogenedentes bacterium]|nr:hypothetical protein [Candidatus Hydrogenedentota bacterium]